jgi:hypothetical protein
MHEIPLQTVHDARCSAQSFCPEVRSCEPYGKQVSPAENFLQSCAAAAGYEFDIRPDDCRPTLLGLFVTADQPACYVKTNTLEYVWRQFAYRVGLRRVHFQINGSY